MNSKQAFSPSLPLSKSSISSIPLISSRSTTWKASVATSITVTKKKTSHVTKVSDNQLSKLIHSQPKSGVIVLKCFANYCRGCKGVDPKFKKIAAAYAPSNNIQFYEIDFATHEQFCRQNLGVENLPFFGIWRDGVYEGGEAMGWTTVNKKLVTKIEQALNHSNHHS